MNRRAFLTSLSAITAVSAGGLLVPEPVRRFWAVGRGAPVGDKLLVFTEGGVFDVNASYAATELTWETLRRALEEAEVRALRGDWYGNIHPDTLALWSETK